MRTTVTIDDDLLKAASAAAGTSERSVVLHEALRALVERDAARRLARLGGSDPRARAPRRRRAVVERPRRVSP
jgi:Arc/MetJ family transcription regulator